VISSLGCRIFALFAMVRFFDRRTYDYWSCSITGNEVKTPTLPRNGKDRASQNSNPLLSIDPQKRYHPRVSRHQQEKRESAGHPLPPAYSAMPSSGHLRLTPLGRRYSMSRSSAPEQLTFSWSGGMLQASVSIAFSCVRVNFI
jgi:hypothetical protein